MRYAYRVTYEEDGKSAAIAFTDLDRTTAYANKVNGRVVHVPAEPVLYDEELPLPKKSAGCLPAIVCTVFVLLFAWFAEEAFAAVTVTVEAAKFWMAH